MEGNKEWVDFKTIKAAVSMQMVLDHYGITGLRKKGEELRGECPIDNSCVPRSFTVNLSKNAFNCFSCKARGNILDLVAELEKCSIKDAALKLKDWFKVGESAHVNGNGSATATQTIKRGLYGDPNPERPNLKYIVEGVARHYASYEEVVVYRELFLDYELRIIPKEDFLQLAKFVREL